MKLFPKIAVLAAGLAASAVTFVSVVPGVVAASGSAHSLSVDVACDCRMGSPLFFSGTRGDAWMIAGKIFPAGTLPTGAATNDPTLPVQGVEPIGEWICRGQSALPFPPALEAAYAASPVAFNTQYFVWNDSRALTLEGYALPGFTGERLSVTGGIRAFSGAAGDVEQTPIGTNGTGCPNLRVTFRFEPGSVPGNVR
jgi:hypothetical protein